MEEFLHISSLSVCQTLAQYMAHHPLPKKLSDALAAAPKYKEPKRSADEKLRDLMDEKGVAPEPGNYSFERQLLDDMLGPSPSQARKERTRNADDSLASGGAAGVSNDALREDLMGSMAKRLAVLEESARKLRQELVEKDKEIANLRSHNEVLSRGVGENGTSTLTNELRESRRENARLKSQIHDMETFLADYGLIWVGAREVPESERPTATDADWQPDFDLLLKRMKELNGLIDEVGPQVVREGQRARFEDQDTVRITVYSNGLVVRGGPLRPYNEDATQVFIHDILVKHHYRFMFFFH